MAGRAGCGRREQLGRRRIHYGRILARIGARTAPTGRILTSMPELANSRSTAISTPPMCRFRRTVASRLLSCSTVSRGRTRAQQAPDKLFRGMVVSNGGHDVHVSCEARLRASRDGEAADQRPATTGPVKVSGGLSQGRIQRVHANLSDGRPSASPKGAPGRSNSHSCSADSISESVALGRSRRSRARCIRRPNSNMSSAKRSRPAGDSSDTPWILLTSREGTGRAPGPGTTKLGRISADAPANWWASSAANRNLDTVRPTSTRHTAAACRSPP